MSAQFAPWTMPIRLAIWHFIQRIGAGVITDSHVLYGTFMHESLDQHKEEIRCLKNVQTASLANVTKQRNDICNLMKTDSTEAVKARLEDYKELWVKYMEAFAAHIVLITDSADLQSEKDRNKSKLDSCNEFVDKVHAWLETMAKVETTCCRGCVTGQTFLVYSCCRH